MNESICRICRIKKRRNFNGYGFNLETKNESRCQYVGIVDANSPASQAGLRGGDKIIEINSINIEFFNHEQIVELIKAGLNINDFIYRDEVLLTVRSKPAENKATKKPAARQFREPKFLKNLNFDANVNLSASASPYAGNGFLGVESSSQFRPSKSMDSLVNKRQSAVPANENDDEAEVVIFI
jgi:predicted metalloprotease with PDZ domain